MHTVIRQRFRAKAHNHPPQTPSPVVGLFDQPDATIWYLRNQNIFGDAEPAEYFYKIKSGCVRTYKTLTDGRRQIGSFYFPGDVFGLEAGERHSISGRID